MTTDLPIFITEDESMKVTELSRALRVTLANIIKRNPVMHAHARTDVQRLYSILLKLWEEHASTRHPDQACFRKGTHQP
jgi:hypothetical protein